MQWVKKEDKYKVPVKSWCAEVDAEAMAQAAALAAHPVLHGHVALMPDCHVGYGMPIGGVIACENALIPNAVGVDIGCGMGAVCTNVPVEGVEREALRAVVNAVKRLVPCGEGNAHKKPQSWDGFEYDIESFSGRGWYSDHVRALASRNLGTLGGGNHFMEIQAGDDGQVWLMIHSGSRHLGNVIARHHNSVALERNTRWKSAIPNRDLGFLPADTPEGRAYIEDMTFALAYARENRRRIMENFMAAFADVFAGVDFAETVNIHHNYAALENHLGRSLWVHRKGATSARDGQLGIIPGSMGTPSFLVEGLGNPESFMSCSHGAGRVLGRMQATRSLTPEECDKAMGKVVYDRWRPVKRGATKGMPDLGEAPQAYKDIDAVIASELDLIRPLARLRPLAVVKG